MVNTDRKQELYDLIENVRVAKEELKGIEQELEAEQGQVSG